ncbi:MAG: pectin acetylesterase-family hydrolase, partial [Polyangiaceae bacterium]
AIFQPDIEQVKAVVQANVAVGYYDTANEANPFRDWYHVVIPYCTGDIHWGDNVATYGRGDSEITIHHKGAVNSRAVLDWVYGNFREPDQIFMTGCSAGSYGSAMWAPHVIQHYPLSTVVQFGDSGAGVITKDFFEESFPSWKADSAFPTWIDSLDPTKVNLLDLELADLYIGMANHYPDNNFSQYNTSFDENQVFYFQTMGGGDKTEWSKQMHTSIERIEANTDNFGAFIAAGEQHCILHFPNFYTVDAGGKKLVDWLSDMLESAPTSSMKCESCDGKTP